MANEVLVAILLTLAAAGLATMYAQQAWQISTTVQQQVGGELKEPAERYISIFRASITHVEGNTYRIQASVYNGGKWDYNYALASFVVSDSNGFVNVITSPNTTCPDVLPAGQICTFSVDVNYPGDPHNLSVIVRVDRVELYVRPTVTPPAEVPAAYFICHSCAECNAAINGGEYGQIIIDINTPASGDCITVKRSGIVISCQSPIVGSGTGTGIHFDHVSDVTFKNCTVENFETGIHFDHSVLLTLSTVTLRGNALNARWSFDQTTCNLGSFSDVTTDEGPLVFLSGTSDLTVSGAAVWLYGTERITISGVGGHVSPTVVLCKDDGTAIFDANIPSGVDQALVSYGSSNFTITGFASLAANGLLFDTPVGGELNANVEVR